MDSLNERELENKKIKLKELKRKMGSIISSGESLNNTLSSYSSMLNNIIINGKTFDDNSVEKCISVINGIIEECNAVVEKCNSKISEIDSEMSRLSSTKNE